MEIPVPIEVPSRRIRGYLSNLRDAILGVRPIAGEGISISEHIGQGTVISLAANQTIDLTVCVDGSPVTYRFVTLGQVS